MKNYETEARKAFWGVDNQDILLQIFPNGCTLQEAIDYFTNYREELECLGWI